MEVGRPGRHRSLTPGQCPRKRGVKRRWQQISVQDGFLIFRIKSRTLSDNTDLYTGLKAWGAPRGPGFHLAGQETPK